MEHCRAAPAVGLSHDGCHPPTAIRKVMQMKIVVDFDLCESNAVCMQIAPDLFEVRDDDFLYVLNEQPGDDDRARVEECVQRCPKQAISIEG